MLLINNSLYFKSPSFAQESTSSATATASPLLETLSPTSLPNIGPTTIPTAMTTLPDSLEAISSAKIRQPAKILPLLKRHYLANESITAKVINIKDPLIKAALFYADGKEVSLSISKEVIGEETVLRISPGSSFKPGKYTLKVTDSNGQESTQDFTWGVLAINPDKATYNPGETAKIAMAVLNEQGAMVCDANVNLIITDPNGTKTGLSTTDKSIIVGPDCKSHAVTIGPDYLTTYNTGLVGHYSLELTAKISNGEFKVNDGFEVRNDADFEIGRAGPTRIFPPNVYPMKITLKANQDFSGTVVERVSNEFTIYPPSEGKFYDQVSIVSGWDDGGVGKSGSYLTNLRNPFDGAYPVTTRFGDQIDDAQVRQLYLTNNLVGHDGIDWAVPMDTPVLAADEGEVVLAGNGIYGVTVVLQHRWGRSYYGHLSRTTVKNGQQVKKGEQLGLSGNTGLSTGPHLHFGVKPNNPKMDNGYYGKVDPAPFLGSVAVVSDYSVKEISWQVQMKKGDTLELGYQFRAPNVSPQFYLLGPVELRSGAAATPQLAGAKFKEGRQWQIAADATVSLEQQINIIDQTYPTTSTSAAPGDGSLGYFYWDAAKYSGIGTQSAQLEIDAKTSATSAQVIGALYDSSGSLLGQSKATIGNANTITTVDSCPECAYPGEAFYTVMTLDSAGYPVIAYHEHTNSDLTVVHCGNANCTANNTITKVDGYAGCPTGCAGNVEISRHKSIVLDSSGYPVITYYDITNSDLWIVHCGDANCASGNDYTLVDGSGASSVGTYSHLKLNSTSGYPIITYLDVGADDLKIAVCSDAACNTAATITRLDGGSGDDTEGVSGYYSSFELDTVSATCTSSPKNCPVIAYRVGAWTAGAGDGHDLKVIHCTNNDCTARNTNIVDDGVSSADSAGAYTSLKLDSAGFPVIVSSRGNVSSIPALDVNLRFVHCDDVNCAAETGNVITLDGTGATNCASTGNCDTGDVGWYNKLQLDTTNGYPIIAYRSTIAADLKVLHCVNANCTGTSNSMIRVDGCPGCDDDLTTSTGLQDFGGYQSMVLDSSGYPVISYRSFNSLAAKTFLKVIHCGNVDCNPIGAGQTNPTNYQTARSAWFTPSLTGGATTRDLTLRVWVTSGTGTVRGARLRIVQSDSTKITDTKSAFELGDAQSVTGTTYADLTNPKYFSYTASKFSAGTKTGYLEASLKGDGGQGQGRIFSSGFEINQSTTLVAAEEWTDVPGGNGTIDGTTKRSGGYAAKLTTPTVARNWRADFAASDQSAAFYFRAYIYISAMPVAEATPVETIMRTANNSGQAVAGIRLTRTDASNGTLDCYNLEDGNNTGVTGTVAVAIDTWYRVEMAVDTTGSNSTALECKVNGTTYASGTGLTITRNQQRINIGSLTSNTALTIFFDDIAINNSTGSWPGSGRIIHMLSDAAGDYSDWTNTFANVNENPPDEATTLVAANTAGNTDDHTLAASGLASTDIINLVTANVRYNGAAASANAPFRLRLKDAPSATDIEYGTPITPGSTTWLTNDSATLILPTLTLYDRPGSSVTPWTNTDLDSAQIGYEVTTTGTNNAQISTVWLLVDYTPTSESSGTTTYAQVEECTDPGSGNTLASCSWSATANGEISAVSSNYELKRSADITLTDGKLYKVTVKRSAASGTEGIANARFVVVQSDAAGISATQMANHYVNTVATDADTTYTDQDYLNYYNPANYSGGTFTYYFEADIKTSAGTGYAQLWNDSDGTAIASSEVPTDLTSYVRVRSSAITPPTTAKNLDTQIKNSATNTTSVTLTTLLIDVTSLQTSVTSTPTLDQLMRHGNWFNNGVEQTFTF